MRYWVHHESDCVWSTEDDVCEQSDGTTEVYEIDAVTYIELIQKGYTFHIAGEEIKN